MAQITYEQREKTYTNAFIRYGRDHQTIKAIEELSECIKELAKLNIHEGDINHAAEEIADSIIMLEQMIEFYGLRELVDRYMVEKITRLEAKLRGEAFG